MNVLQYAQIFQQSLDAQMVAAASSGWMELGAAMVKYNGGNTIKIPKILMDGLADYDREDGFTKGAVSLSWETHEFTQDRARTFSLDRMDVDETNFVTAAGMVMGEFQRTQVIPEIDAYRYSKIATLAIEASKASGGYTADDDDILQQLKQDIARIQDVVGENESLVISMPHSVAAIFDLIPNNSSLLPTMDFVQGNLTMKVRSIDGIPILRVPSARMKTAYVLNDGKTAGQEAGGFVAAAGAKDINWVISAKRAIIAISKTDNIRIFDPAVNQTMDAWKLDYRKYHDLWIPDNKKDAIWVNIKQALV